MPVRVRIKTTVVSIWPSLPYLIRRSNWLSRLFQALGLMSSDLLNPRLSPTLPRELSEIATAYRRGNLEYFVTGRLIQLQDRDVARTMKPFLEQIDAHGSVDDSNILDQIAEFRRTYLSSPISNNHGGLNYTTGLALFLITRHLDPAFIIESGVYRGMSSMLLRAASPHALIFSFDINLSNLRHRSENVEYHECDWGLADLQAKEPALAFFDDHVSQAKRVVEAHHRGFRHLVFDDSWSWGAISGCGGPPLPSIDMLMSEDIRVGEKIEWVEAGRLWTYTHDEERSELCSAARKLIVAAHDVPSLFRETGVHPTSAMKFVRLV
jgi:hypothetical protein